MLLDRKLYDKISDRTMTCYDEIIDNPGAKYLYASENAITSIIEDLLVDIDNLQEKIEDLEQDIQDNYRPITKEEMYLG